MMPTTARVIAFLLLKRRERPLICDLSIVSDAQTQNRPGPHGEPLAKMPQAPISWAPIAGAARVSRAPA
jgi:hypothetical protein